MKRKVLTVTEFARLGGKARQKSQTKAQRSEAARKAVNARWEAERKRKLA